MDSQAFLSSDPFVASKSPDIDDDRKRNSLKKGVNFPRSIESSPMWKSDEGQTSFILSGQRGSERKDEENDNGSENCNGDPFKSDRCRLFKPGQMIRVHFPSSSHVVHGIENGDLYYRRRRGRDWFRVSARCVSRISNRTTSSRVLLKGRCVSSFRRNGRCDVQRSSSSRCRQLKQLLRGQAWKVPEVITDAEESSRKQKSLSSAGQISRKRRVGIVENQYVAESDGGSSVCDLVRGLERLFGEEDTGDRQTMKSKKQQNAEEGIIDPIEENETYDEFDTVRMPIVRSLSKSPQSDEGIETDSDRRRATMARCWSLDSAAASDEDTSLTTHQQKRHKLRVTRCCSSDSAVLSDEDQIKGWDSSNMIEESESEYHEGRPRYWRTPSVVVSDYSDYSYLDEKLERNDIDLEKYEETSGTPSQASSCSCLDCDEVRESLDNQFLQVCRTRRHSDSCCLGIDSINATTGRNLNEAGSRRNSCLDSTESYYSKLNSQFAQYSLENRSDLEEKSKADFLNIPPARKISDCSTTSSLSGDESDVADLPQTKSSKKPQRSQAICERLKRQQETFTFKYLSILSR